MCFAIKFIMTELQSAVCVCVCVVPHNVSQCVLRTLWTGGQPCGLPRQQLQFIMQPRPSGSSRGFSGPPQTSNVLVSTPGDRSVLEQTKRGYVGGLCDAVNHHSLKTNFITTHAAAPAAAESLERSSSAGSWLGPSTGADPAPCLDPNLSSAKSRQVHHR